MAKKTYIKITEKFKIRQWVSCLIRAILFIGFLINGYLSFTTQSGELSVVFFLAMCASLALAFKDEELDRILVDKKTGEETVLDFYDYLLLKDDEKSKKLLNRINAEKESKNKKKVTEEETRDAMLRFNISANLDATDEEDI